MDNPDHDYKIIQFLNETTSDGKLAIELIPTSWIRTEDHRDYCYFPLEEHWSRLEEWVERKIEPDKYWKKYSDYKILGSAANYEQGLRRLYRAFRPYKTLESTDSDSERRRQKRDLILSKSVAKRLLRESEPYLSTVEEEKNTEIWNCNDDSRDDSRSIHKDNNKIVHCIHKPGDINNNPSDNSSNFQDTDGSLKSSESSNFSKSKNRHTLNRKESKKRNYKNYKRIQNVISSDSGSEENERIRNLLENTNEKTSCTYANDLKKNELMKHDKNSKKHLNVMSVVDSRLIHLKEKNDDPLRIFIADYIDARISKLEEKLVSKIESIKRSILHDMDKHMGKLNMIVANSNRIECANIPSLRNILPDLPIKNLEDFLKFERELALTNQGNEENSEDTPDYYSELEKQNALKVVMRGFANRCEDYEKCITACIPEIIKKAVQQNYSGKGRKTKISQKENFSATLTYKCLEDVLLQRYGERVDIKMISQKVGKYLSGAGDREGGCSQRKNK